MWPEAVIVIHIELVFVFTLPCRSLSVKFDGTLLWQVSAASSAIFFQLCLRKPFGLNTSKS